MQNRIHQFINSQVSLEVDGHAFNFNGNTQSFHVSPHNLVDLPTTGVYNPVEDEDLEIRYTIVKYERGVVCYRFEFVNQ